MRRMLGALSLFAFAPLALAQSVFINEFHYDNTGADSGEAVEIAAPAGTDLTGWDVVPYNGANGQTYSITALPAAPTGTCGDFDLYLVPIAGLQNGAPDGIALVDGANAVIQFLSYEGSFTATNGPANTMMSVDIGVSQGGGGAVGNSLQLSGSGNDYDDFTWQAEGPNTFSACNTGQTLDIFPSVVSSTPQNVSPSTLTSVTFQIAFSEAVSGVDVTDLSLTTTGVAGASIVSTTPPGGAPSTLWNVDVNTGTGDGTIRVNVLDDDTIVDSIGNPLGDTGAGNGAFSAGVDIVMDKTPPTVQSVALNSANPTNAATVEYLVTFSEDVGGLDVSDFAVTEFGGLSGSSVNAVSGGATVWTVTVNTGSPSGDLRLDVLDDDSIVDGAGNALNGGFTGGDIATIDKVGPTVTIDQAMGQTDPTSTSPVLFTVIFSESVSNFATGDVTLSGTAGATTADVTGSGSTYTVSVSGMTANGTVIASLDVGAATDALSNPSAASTSTDNTVTFNDPPPTVVSIVRASADPTGAGTVSWTVTFNESVTGVDASDFALANTGLTGPSISGVTGSGTTWTVSAGTGTGVGTLGLNLVDDDSVLDSFNNPLGSAGAGNGNFTGEVYTVDASAPTVVSILRTSASPTTSPTTVIWTVTFSEAVTGVDASDFVLISGPLLVGATITDVSGSGTTWTITADSGTGGGSLDIDLIDDDSIIDGLNNPLGGAGAGNGNFTAGQGFVIFDPLAARPIPTLSELGLLLTALLVLIGGGLSARRYS